MAYFGSRPMLGVVRMCHIWSVETTARSLPVVLGELVGRDDELRELTDLVVDRRLVTLTGAPGIGKTRLATELAHRALDAFHDGATFASLASLTDEAHVALAVAAPFGLQEDPGGGIIDALALHIGEDRILMVLDNCEHVVDACATVAYELLRSCPGLSVLATSREPLGVTGERVWRVKPLDTAGPDSGAVRLFCGQARAADPSFNPTAAEFDVIRGICDRLDGLPLAIELAAARVDLFTVGQIAERLDDLFALLRAGSRTALPRHQTLKRALDWSYDLLSETERALLRRASLFVGGWTVDAVTEVCNGGVLSEAEVVDVLGRLVAKSLAVRDRTTSAPRYRLLETVRSYGLGKLAEAGETQDYAERHVWWARVLAERGEQGISGHAQAAWCDRLLAEHDNIRAALRWTLAVGDVDEATRLASGMTMFWGVRGFVNEGCDWLEGVLALPPPMPRRERALWCLAFLLSLNSNFPAAQAHAEESLFLARQTANRSVEARALMILAICALFIEEMGPAGALARFDESAKAARSCGDNWCLVCALTGIAWVRNLQGEPTAARSLLHECLSVAREAHDAMGLATAINMLGGIALRQGDLVAAEAVLSESASISQTLGNLRVRAESINLLGEVASREGDLARARRLFQEGLDLARTAGCRSGMIDSFANLGETARRAGEMVRARSYFAEALSLAWQVDATCPAALLGLGRVSADSGDLWAAEALLDRAVTAAQGPKDRGELAGALLELAQLARRRGELDRALTLSRESLDLWNEHRDPIGIATALQLLAGLAALGGRYEQAALLFGGAAATLEATDVRIRQDELCRTYEADLAYVRDCLGAEEVATAMARGRTLSVEEASLLANEKRKSSRRPVSGWASLTKAEREVSLLVAESLTNREIGERLFISPRTVQTHLAHVFAKLGIASRRDLARAVLKRHGGRPEALPSLTAGDSNGAV